jgi:hypothetical protein
LNESTYEKSYDGLELPLGPAPVCGLKSLLCKEGRGVWWCHWLLFSAFFCVRMQIRYVGAPSMPPGHCQDLGKAKLPYRQLNNPSCHIIGNLWAHAIPTRAGATSNLSWRQARNAAQAPAGGGDAALSKLRVVAPQQPHREIVFPIFSSLPAQPPRTPNVPSSTFGIDPGFN